ncbi:CDP-glucose 4,6-dehydratase [Parvularcula lutaonensis]|uniref:CDP-glucose 4,6-dehydratase n=1 Tax=Parvularcula lutaonensis TaxID=491923 RepID=A0ABV7M8P9_9PROT|nr:CDP-glucose 4,6-dehydratase [Parvularcula lutaonensis]GGY44513.1 CDP-glucose 4,6-dehydratase [Parvularcula lutaonensis]
MSGFEDTLRGRSVFLTGHTGFTGSWLTSWLTALDCDVHGYALAPEMERSLFDLLGGASRYASSTLRDLNDHQALKAAMAEAKPSVVIHLAAQPLVRRSYRDPLETFASNVTGTASLLEAARNTDGVEAVVCITTDKVYANREWVYPYREVDTLGGKDPYSASKAAAEIVTASYQQTMAALGNGVKIATARGGNIIGGGDWSEDRLIPDFYRAAMAGEKLVIRSPDAIRPWQHVLSACHGYLAIAHDLLSAEGKFEKAWNIGPGDGAALTVREVLNLLAETSTAPEVVYEESHLPEAQTLKLDISKAVSGLAFMPPWNTEEAIRRTGEWYGSYADDPSEAAAMTDLQISDYRDALSETTR